MKPLFIPLKAEFYDAFEAHLKEFEYRLAGPRWNAGTCIIGRLVVLSCGYSGARRVGVISNFATWPLHDASAEGRGDPIPQSLPAAQLQVEQLRAIFCELREVQIERRRGDQDVRGLERGQTAAGIEDLLLELAEGRRVERRVDA